MSAGPIALVGSGEYLPAMDDVDLALLERVGGPAGARVVVLPTAAGLEGPASVARWVRMGVDHFTRLGARADAAAVLTRDDAFDPVWSEMLDGADLIYFSGGNPVHLVETLAGSPLWAGICRRHGAGAALAGCSAGAMAFAGLTSNLRAQRDSGMVEWLPALGLLPRVIVLPHFDRFSSFMGPAAIQRAAAAVPDGMALLGIDEETALVIAQPSMRQGDPAEGLVMGQQSVSVFLAGRDEAAVCSPGAAVAVPGW